MLRVYHRITVQLLLSFFLTQYSNFDNGIRVNSSVMNIPWNLLHTKQQKHAFCVSPGNISSSVKQEVSSVSSHGPESCASAQWASAAVADSLSHYPRSQLPRGHCTPRCRWCTLWVWTQMMMGLLTATIPHLKEIRHYSYHILSHRAKKKKYL